MKPSVEENIVKSVRDGLSIRECAQKFKVSHTTVQRLKKNMIYYKLSKILGVHKK